MDKHDPVIVSAVRTPIGAFGGSLMRVTHTDLAATVIGEACKRANFPKEELDDIYWGVVMPRSDENGLARSAALKAGVPDHVSAVQVNRACCSAMEAIRIGSMAVRLGEAKAVLAGGGESMSNVPYSLKGARWGLRLRHGEISDGLWDGLTDHYTGLVMGMTAENIAAEHNISREDQDAFAYTSQLRARRALDTGRFSEEIVAVRLPGRGGKEPREFVKDEHPRPETTPKDLQALPPAFKIDGTVTAGNSSGINDGAAAVLILSREEAEALQSRIKWRIVGSTAVGVDPRIMGIGPVPAIRKLLHRTGHTLQDIELIEINEAFASASVAVERELGLDREIVNVNGGGIALGHPIGSTGCRIVVTLIHEMEKRGLNLGLAALCGGGGHGQAILIERA